MTTAADRDCSEPARPPDPTATAGPGDAAPCPGRPAAGAEPGRRMTTYYAVRLDPGARWDPAKGTREQELWDEHARHVDALFDQGLIVLGGPYADRTGSMVVVRARDARHAFGMFRDDPWNLHDVLVVGEIKPWTIFLDGRHRCAEPSRDNHLPTQGAMP